MDLHALLKRLIKWFLGRANPVLESLELERISGDEVELIRYQRKTVRAYRTWKAVYKTLEYDLIFGWNTLEYIPDVPMPPKKNKLSTHSVHIYKQGYHAQYNALKKIHEPDIQVILSDEVCLELPYMEQVLWQWKTKTKSSKRPILTREDLTNYIIDQVARCTIRHPPSEIEPAQIDWRSVVEDTVRVLLGSRQHKVFPDLDG